MRTRIWVTMAGCLLAAAAAAHAQPNQKPGLYEITSNMTWQKSPFPPGMQVPPQASAAFGGGPHTSQVCLSQAWVDRFGGPVPQGRGDCKMANVSTSPTGMTGTMMCTGQMNGTGEIKVDWGGGTATGKVHFAGTMQMGRNGAQGAGIPVEWTQEFTSTYKGADCGSVKPLAVPADK